MQARSTCAALGSPLELLPDVSELNVLLDTLPCEKKSDHWFAAEISGIRQIPHSATWLLHDRDWNKQTAYKKMLAVFKKSDEWKC